MGESRKYETSLPVISRFAEAVAGKAQDRTRDRDLLTLGMAGQQMERKDYPWAAFEGIRLKHKEDYTGLPPREVPAPPSYIRFVDLWWGDLLAAQAQDWMQPSRAWSEGLLGRLERLPKHSKDNTLPAKPPRWIMQLLYEVSELLVPAETYLGFTNKKARDLIFTQFLGDVQLYAEYPPMRGLAVRRFHERMAELHQAHLAEQSGISPSYTILAHSLGSIMALDALLYAHARQDIRAGHHVIPSIRYFPFDGYLTPGPLPNTDWINNVCTLVTLGSPIDKYLQIWKHNYEYLNDPEAWVEPGLPNRPITHLNYCEEQDPVGHNLDQWQRTEAFKELFHARGTSPNASRDTVYRRHAMPGVAHVSYWKDRGLFEHIWQKAIDRPEAAQAQQPSKQKKKSDRQDRLPHKKGTYLLIILLSYLFIPFITILLAHFSLMGALNASSWQTLAASTAIFVSVCWVDRKLLNLIIWWRQIVRNKLKKADNEAASKDSVAVFKPDLAYPFGQWAVRLGLPLFALGHVYLALYYLSEYFSSALEFSKVRFSSSIFAFLNGPLLMPKENVAFFLWLALSLGILIWIQLKSGNYLRMVFTQAKQGNILTTAFTADAVTVVLGVVVVWGAWNNQREQILTVLIIFMVICALIWFVWSHARSRYMKVADWVSLFLVIVLAFGVGHWMINGSFHALIANLGFCARTFGLYNFIAMIIWSYVAARFFIAKSQLSD